GGGRGNGFGGGGFGGGRGGGGPQSSLGPDRGPDFFAQRVKDDPQPTGLYDPQLDVKRSQHLTTHISEHGQEDQHDAGIRVISATEEQQPTTQPGATAPPAQGTPGVSPGGVIRAPRSNIESFALPELGGIVIQGNNPEDVRLAEEIIRFIQEQFAGSEPQIVMVPLL